MSKCVMALVLHYTTPGKPSHESSSSQKDKHIRVAMETVLCLCLIKAND
jgi:hypothetical protein